MIKREYEYYAFISYSRKDEKWAKWIQKSLETYRFPTALKREHKSLPKKIFPVFRDKTDLSGGILEEQLHRQLDESEYLIVICSPASAKSTWVNEEVLHFRSLGREDCIIPIIVGGEPHASDPEKECFCPALTETVTGELLGISVLELGKKYALLRVISTLMRIRYDQLVMRERRRTIKNRLILGGITALVMTLGVGVVWYEMPHSAYYWSYVRRNEIPVGRHKLSKEEQQSADAFYKIVTQRNKVIRVERVNSAGIVPVDRHSGNVDGAADYPVSKFSYDDQGNLSTVTQYDEEGQAVLEKRYSRDLRAVDFKNPVSDSMIAALASDMLMQKHTTSYKADEQGGITRKLLQYDENGYLAQELYMWDVRNTPYCDENGIYGKRYKRDAEGNVLRITNLDKNGQPLRLLAFTDYEYDNCGRTTKISLFDANGAPLSGDDGVHALVMKYDNAGCLSRELSCNIIGELVPDAKGVAETRYAYDERGFLIEKSFYDRTGAPVYGKAPDSYHKELWERDESGRPVLTAWFGVDGAPAVHNGCAAIADVYDPEGRLAETWFCGPNGELTRRSVAKCAGVRVEYPDENTTQYTYLDAEGNPTLTVWGYARLVKKHNELGLITEQSFYGEDLKPIQGRENYASFVLEYDGAGRPVAARYYDETDAPCCTIHGCAVVLYTYDNNGNQDSASFLDADGKPCSFYSIDADGNETVYARRVFTFNSMGQKTSVRFFDSDGELVPMSGVYESRYEYDERGFVNRASFHDAVGNLMDAPEGHAVVKKTYDKVGRIIREVRMNKNGNACFTVEKEYNERGLLSSETVTDGDRNIIRTVFEYDDRGSELLCRKENAHGQPIVAENGFAFRETRYDEMGRPVHTAYFDAKHESVNVDDVAIVEQSYDIYGCCTEKRIHAVSDEGGNPAFKYMFRMSYDEFGYEETVRLFAGTEKSDADALGDINTISVYNVCGDELSMATFNREGKMLWNDNGYYLVTTAYNSAGQAIRRDYFDAEGKPMTRESGYPASRLITLDVCGRKIAETLLDETGNPFPMNETDFQKKGE